jgi:hypothetical protein
MRARTYYHFVSRSSFSLHLTLLLFVAVRFCRFSDFVPRKPINDFRSIWRSCKCRRVILLDGKEKRERKNKRKKKTEKKEKRKKKKEKKKRRGNARVCTTDQNTRTCALYIVFPRYVAEKGTRVYQYLLVFLFFSFSLSLSLSLSLSVRFTRLEKRGKSGKGKTVIRR